jgi:hypothetical protein
MFVFTPGYSALFPYYSAAEAFYYALHEALFRFTPVVAVGFIAAISIVRSTAASASSCSCCSGSSP